MTSGPGLVRYLLEAPWEEGVAANLPPPLLQVPPVSAALDLVCPVATDGTISPVDREVLPPLAPTDPAAPG